MPRNPAEENNPNHLHPIRLPSRWWIFYCVLAAIKMGEFCILSESSNDSRMTVNRQSRLMSYLRWDKNRPIFISHILYYINIYNIHFIASCLAARRIWERRERGEWKGCPAPLGWSLPCPGAVPIHGGGWRNRIADTGWSRVSALTLQCPS